MADTKISALTAVATPAGADEFPVNQSSASKKVTLTQIATFARNAPVWAGGTASANTWPKFSTGTLLTTPEVGAIELDANCLYGTTDAGNRGVISIRHFIRQHADRTLLNQTGVQKAFDGSTNGTLTLETGTYRFETLLYLTSMSGSSGNLKFQLVAGGGATTANVLYMAYGRDAAVDASSAPVQTMYQANDSNGSVITAATTTVLAVFIEGTFEVTGAGTIIPSVALLTAAAAVVKAGSYFECARLGASTAVSVGQWS